MMKLLLLTILFTSCSFNLAPPNSLIGSHETLMTTTANQYYVDSEQAFIVDIKSPYKLPNKELAKRLIIIENPTAEILPSKSSSINSAVLIKITKQKNLEDCLAWSSSSPKSFLETKCIHREAEANAKHNIFSQAFKIVPRKPLQLHSTYGIYFHNSLTNLFELIHVFKIKKTPFTLVKHDMEKDHKQLTAFEDRRIFTLTFDEKVYLHDDQAIEIVNLDNNNAPLHMEELTVTHDGKTVILRLLAPALLAGKRYAIIFNSGLKNSEGHKSLIEPLVFKASAHTQAFSQIIPTTIKISDHSVELKGAFSKQDYAYLFIANSDNDFSKTHSFIHLGTSPEMKPQHRFYVQGLTHSTSYRFLIFSEAVNGELFGIDATFQTPEKNPLRISEIMTHPVALADSSLEYLEIVNLGEDEVLPSLKLFIEDVATLKTTSCDLKSIHPLPLLKPHQYAIIVGRNFDQNHYQLDDNVAIIRLKQKSICRGFKDSKKKIIDLADANGNFLDRYGGHKWPQNPGQSVQRLDPMGLDEESNYCYSSQKLGPTPGKINGPCA